jgi:hypothetical protein
MAKETKGNPDAEPSARRPPSEASWQDPDRPRGIPGVAPGEGSAANPDDTHEGLEWSLAYTALPPETGAPPHSQPVEVDADVLAWFQAGSGDITRRINDVLRAHMKSQGASGRTAGAGRRKRPA